MNKSDTAVLKNPKAHKSETLTLTEGAIMLAVSIVLSLLTPFQKILPFGGSITLLSMLPVIMFSIRHGVKKGMTVSVLFAVFQFLEGTVKDGLFAWGLTPLMLSACILFDYLIPFSVLGAAGIFRNKGKKGWIAGAVTVMLIRFFSHFLSGVVVFATSGKIWDDINFIAKNKYIYSLVYNAAFMVPEIILTTIAAAILFSSSPIKKLMSENN